MMSKRWPNVEDDGPAHREHTGACRTYVTDDTRHQTNVDLMLAHRLRRWPNIKSTLVEHFVFAG